MIHLFFVDNATQAETGDFDHFAFLGSDFADMKAKLVERGIEFRENKVAGGTTKQLFFPTRTTSRSRSTSRRTCSVNISEAVSA